jgi:fucose 4-O-acetylase-like acetyltransferase
VRVAVAAGLVIAAASPLMANLNWSGTPPMLQDYLVPSPRVGRFPFFPCASYLAFGLAAGTIAKRAAADRVDRLMQWSVLIGFAVIFTGQYFANLPYSIYTKSNFWSDSPALILIRVGITLLLMAASYLWTEYCAGAGWSWMQVLGKNSLMVYWVHVMLVYGSIVRPIKRQLSVPQSVLATVIVTAMMVALSVLWLRWKARRPGPQRVKAAA